MTLVMLLLIGILLITSTIFILSNMCLAHMEVPCQRPHYWAKLAKPEQLPWIRKGVTNQTQ